MIILGIIGGLGLPELLVIALVLLLFFGGRKIPELMRGLGKGIKSFKEGVNGITEEPKKAAQAGESAIKSAIEDTEVVK
jgi:sec-independent protein translocase protein TatA